MVKHQPFPITKEMQQLEELIGRKKIDELVAHFEKDVIQGTSNDPRTPVGLLAGK